jgi:hypothetical protein
MFSKIPQLNAKSDPEIEHVNEPLNTKEETSTAA